LPVWGEEEPLLALVLAIVPAHERGPIFHDLAREFSGHEFIAARMTSDAFARVGARVPDLVVFPLSLFPTEKAALVARLDQWSGQPSTPSTHALTTSPEAATHTHWFYWFKPRQAKAIVRRVAPFAAAISTISAARRAVAVHLPGPARIQQTAQALVGVLRVAALSLLHLMRTVVIGLLRLTRSIARRLGVAARSTARLLRTCVSACARSITSAATATVGVSRTAFRLGVPRLVTLCRVIAHGLRAGIASALHAGSATCRVLWGLARRAGSATRSRTSDIHIPLPAVRRSVLRFVAVTITAALAVFATGEIVRRVQAMRISAPVAPQSAPSHAPPAALPAKPTPKGRLEISSDPAGAAVLVDGQIRGSTPFVIESVTAGMHTVVFDHNGGIIRQTVRVKANETATVNAAIYSGWVAFFAPFEIQVSEGGRSVNLDDHHQGLLSPGSHELTISNTALGYSHSQTVAIQPGEVTPVTIVPPKSAVTVTASGSAEVWIDGSRVGETPLQTDVAVGTREVVIRSATLGERKVVTTVTTKPLHLDIDFTKPDAGR
jgi:hypothetical protein